MAYEKSVIEKSILDTSRKFLFRYGYKNLNLNDVAKEIGISKTTLYKIYGSKYIVAEKIIDNIISEATEKRDALLSLDLPINEKLEKAVAQISSIFSTMDDEFLKDLQNTVPELWNKIDLERKSKEDLIVKLIFHEQQRGTVKNDHPPEILAAILLSIIQNIFSPDFFLKHNTTPNDAGAVAVNVFLKGCLN